MQRTMPNFLEKIWKSKKDFLIAVFSLGLFIRLAYVFSLEEKWYFYDTRHYEKAAISLIQNKTFGNGYLYDEIGGMKYSLEPIYPVFLATIYAIFGHHFWAVRAVQAILGAFLLIMIFLIAERVYPYRNVPKFASLIAVFYPYLIFISGLLYVTMLFTVILSLLVYEILIFHENPNFLRAGIIGGLIALSIYCRPIILFFVPFWILWEVIYRKESWARWIEQLITVAILFLIVISPWEIRNYKIFHRITPIRAYKGEINRLDKQYQLAELKLGNFGGDVLRADIQIDSSGNHFLIYYNNIYKGELNDSLKLLHPEKYYSGIYLKGGQKNGVATFSAMKIDNYDSLTCSTNFSNFKNRENWYLTSSINIENELKVNRKKEWGNFAICREIENPRSARLQWGKHVSGQGVQEGGLFLMVDDFSDSANGYYVVRKPTGHLSLWLIKNGKPFRGLEYRVELNSPFSQKGLLSKIMHLALTTPKAFFISYSREFIKFWDPIISESIDSKNPFNSGSIKKLGELSYAILLFFMLFAFLYLLKEKNRDKPILLFLVILSFAVGYSIFGVRTRYRIPSDPYLIIFSAAGIVYFFKSILGAKISE